MDSDSRTHLAFTRSISNVIETTSCPARNTPAGIRLFGRCYQFKSPSSKRTYHMGLVLIMTFIAYTTFHMGRRPLSIVKNVLNRDCSNITASESEIYKKMSESPQVKPKNYCDWAPFDDDATADKLMALLDTAFLSTYAIMMFVSGFVAERVNLRYLISAGATISGLGLIQFGLAYPLNIHSMLYFTSAQIVAGAAQTTGWPVVVTCLGNWFPVGRRGLIYGLWNSHTNLGNILGAVIAGYFVETNWSLSFIVPGSIMIGVGLLLVLFLVPKPEDVRLESTNDASKSDDDSSVHSASTTNVSNYHRDEPERKAVPFLTALRIPGVIEFSLCLFFSKLVSYTFLFWLPRYIKATTSNDSEHSAYLSTPFEIGGILGAIIAGYLSDKFKANGTICNVMLLLAIPSLYAFQKYGTRSVYTEVTFLLMTGILTYGPAGLMTTTVSADLGSRVKDGRAMATVTAIIDGFGSLGAVLGPLYAGLAADSGDWQAVFNMLMLAVMFACLSMTRLTIQELKSSRNRDSTVKVDC